MFFFGRNDFDKTFGEGTQLQSFVAQLQILAEVYDKQTPPFTSGEQSLQRSSMIKNYLLHGDKNIYIYMQIIYELDTHYIT